MVAAAVLIAQQNPSSQHETVFPSETRWNLSRKARQIASYHDMSH
jgi:hypothetical protein